MVGKKLQHYNVQSILGKGGMGEVYVAEDTRLKRRVALKVLPPEMAADPERRSRFEREAQAVAALNHPNIVTIHSVEQAGDVHFITMELIEGSTLTDLIPAAGLELHRVLELAIPLADAVGAAHRAGVLHRDLKPDNVMVDGEGRLKVLDFGLAKLHENVGAAGQTATHMATPAITQEGKILGTFTYMSPEQAEGRPLGPNSDVFSLGAILYEMATGRRPFEGDTPISTITSILRDQPPPLTDLKQTMPRHLARIVRRSLAKDPRRRYPTGEELRNELEALKEEVDSGLLDAPVSEAEAPVSRRGGIWPALAAAALIVGGLAGWLLAPSGGTERRSPAIGKFTHLTFQAGVETTPTISPDGAFVAYSGGQIRGQSQGIVGGLSDIYLQRVSGRNAINLTEGNPERDYQPAFSPDGKYIAFRSERQGGGIFVMGATGEAVRRLTDVGYNPAWSPDGGSIVFATETGIQPLSRSGQSALWIVDVQSGETRQIYAGDAVHPSWSPGGSRIAFWRTPVGGVGSGQRDILTIAADGSDPVAITDDVPVDWNPVWAADGKHLFFCSDRNGSMNLWRVAIDESSGRPLDEPEPMTTPSEWSGPIAVAADGKTLAFASFGSRSHIMKVPIDIGSGEVRGAVEYVTRGAIQVDWFDLSPDGEWLVFRNYGRQEDIYLVRSDGTELRKLTDDIAKDRAPKWSPDGERIAFYSNRGNRYEIWAVRRDGSGLEQLTESSGPSIWYPAWSPDGKRLKTYNSSEGTFVFDMAETPMKKEDAIRVQPGGEAEIFSAWDWSPDGTRLAGEMTDEPGSSRQVVVVNVESGESATFTADWVEGSWAGDDRRLIGMNRNGELSLLDTKTGSTSRIELGMPVALRVQIAPDGRTLYFVSQIDEADIWLASLE